MRLRVLSLLCIIAMIAYVQRCAISVPAGTIQDELAISPQSMGWVMGAWYWSYALCQIPSGWLADRWGVRRALPLYALVWSFLTGLIGLATNFYELLILWSLMGCAQAGLFPCATKSVGARFTDAQRASGSGWLAGSMAIGIAVAPALTAWLLIEFSWQRIFVLYALPGVVWAGLFFLLVPETSATRAAAAGSQGSAGLVLRRLFTSVPLALLCAQQFLRAGALVFFSTWFPRYLQEAHGASQFASGKLAVWPGAGAVVGGVLGGYASDWILRYTGSHRLSRQGIAIAGMTCSALLFGAAYFAVDTAWAVALMSLGAFWATFGGVSGYSVAMEFGGSRVATMFSVMNMCGTLGAGAFPIAVAWLVQKYHNWDLAPLLFAGVFAIDALCWTALDPRGTLFKEVAA